MYRERWRRLVERDTYVDGMAGPPTEPARQREVEDLPDEDPPVELASAGLRNTCDTLRALRATHTGRARASCASRTIVEADAVIHPRAVMVHL